MAISKHLNLRDSAGAQLCVFCFSLPVDGNIGVGILP
jgi:hypothetical protein